jgi:hypothetical protein
MQYSLLSRIAAHMALAAMLSSCSSSYSGDGHLIDNGPFSAQRYILDLGEVALDQQGSFNFRMQRLPTRSFAIGIEIRVAARERAIIYNAATKPNSAAIKPTVRIELIGPDRKPMIQHQSALDSWTWSVSDPSPTAFVYRRKDPATYFVPAAGASYELRITVVEPDPSNSNYEARIMLKSGGWK